MNKIGCLDQPGRLYQELYKFLAKMLKFQNGIISKISKNGSWIDTEIELFLKCVIVSKMNKKGYINQLCTLR